MIEKNLLDKYLNWENLRWIFPLIFAAIMTSHLYGYLFPPKHKAISKVAPDPFTEHPTPFNNSISMTDTPQTDESMIENEFKLLCEFLLLQASQSNRIPPEQLSDAIEEARRAWKGSQKQFDQAYRFISKKTDPWKQAYVYRRDLQSSAIFLQSFGPNGLDDQTKGDDIHVVRNYHVRGAK